jgi:hypothetical protein
VRLKLVRVYKLEDLALKLLACYHPALMFRVLRLAPSDLSKGSISSESYALLLVGRLAIILHCVTQVGHEPAKCRIATVIVFMQSKLRNAPHSHHRAWPRRAVAR